MLRPLCPPLHCSRQGFSPTAGCSGLQCDGLRRYFHSLYSQQECLKKDTSINVSSKHKIIALCLLKNSKCSTKLHSVRCFIHSLVVWAASSIKGLNSWLLAVKIKTQQMHATIATSCLFYHLFSLKETGSFWPSLISFKLSACWLWRLVSPTERKMKENKVFHAKQFAK